MHIKHKERVMKTDVLISFRDELRKKLKELKKSMGGGDITPVSFSFKGMPLYMYSLFYLNLFF